MSTRTETPIATEPGPETPQPDDSGTRSLGQALLREWLPVTLLFLVLGCVLTWPLVTHMSSGFFGFGNDNWGGIWNGKWIHDAFWGPESTGFTREIQFPFGYEFDDRYIQPYDRLIAIVFGAIGDGLFAYNLMVLVSFPLAGVSMYALAKYLTGSAPASLLAGVIFSASPFHVAMSMQYPPMASIFVVPLFVLALLVAVRRGRIVDAAWLGAAFALVWITSYYYGWFAIWFAIPFLIGVAVAGLWRARREHRVVAAMRDGARFVVTRGAVAAGTFLVIAVPLLISLISKVLSDQGTYARQEADLDYTAVRPWQYVLPPHDNPVFGNLTSDVVLTHTGILPVYEQSVYIGVVAGLLALVALVWWSRARPAARVAFIPLLLGAAFCVLLTLGPKIPYEVTSIGDWLSPGTNPHFDGPVAWIYDLSPNFRYYGRAFVFVSTVLASLAAVGFALLLARFRADRRPWIPWAVTAALSGLVLLEFIGVPPSRFVDLSTPPWVQAVKELPGEAPVIEYPLGEYSSPRSLQDNYWQTRHGHPTVNPPLTPESQAFQRSVDDPDSYLTGRILSQAGVKYAVMRTDLPAPTFPPYQPALPVEEMKPTDGAKNPWFTPYKRTKDAVIYEVLPRPSRQVDYAVAGFDAGWGDLEVDATGRWRWTRNPDSQMTIYSSRDVRRATMTFTATSFNEPRTMVLSLDGKEVYRREIPVGRTVNVRAPMRLRKGSQKLLMSSDPPPTIVDTVLRNGDLRAIGLRVTPPKITLDERR